MRNGIDGTVKGFGSGKVHAMAGITTNLPEGIVERSRDVFLDGITKEDVRPYFRAIYNLWGNRL